MKTQPIPHTSLDVTRIAYGCMQLAGWQNAPVNDVDRRRAVAIVEAALAQGINFFDHADIYGRGRAEEAFAAVWQAQPNLRDRIVLQTKCGIRFGDEAARTPGRYDFSHEWIAAAVEASLRRLATDRIDILLLHRPDPLVEPEEVARAFDDLHRCGKVLHFGVSNHTGMQIDLLRRYVRQPIVANQLELSLLHYDLIEAGIITNQHRPESPVRGDGTLEYCRLHDISVQAWGPMAKGLPCKEPAELTDERHRNLAAVVGELAAAKAVSREAVVLAWLLRHPARIVPIIGTTKPDRIAASCQADNVQLSREEWYRLYEAARAARMP